jgi:hypothetical protein
MDRERAGKEKAMQEARQWKPQVGDAITYHDTVTHADYTGTVLELKPATRGRFAVACIRWDDGYRDSWVRQSELKQVA